MTLASAITDVYKKARCNKSHTATDVMNKINIGLQEFSKTARTLTKEDYVTVTPLFDLQTIFAIRVTIVGGANALTAVDVPFGADATDQTGTQAATALQTAIRAAITAGGGTPSLTVSWSTTAWTFTINAIDSTSITLAEPTTIIYSSALTMLGFDAETTVATSVTGGIPQDCTLESALPTDFVSMATHPEWDGVQLMPMTLLASLSPKASGTPTHYYIRNKNIRLYPTPEEQGLLHIFYKYIPTAFTTPQGYQECGLSGKILTKSTGLTATTTYYFKVNIDGSGVVEYSITTAALLTFEDIIDLMNDQTKGATWSLVNGDLRCTSDLVGAGSSISLSAGTTGTNLFATLTGWSAFDTAVATQAGDELPVDDEYAEAVCYFAASKICEETREISLADRFHAQGNRILTDFKVHRANNNTSMFPRDATPPDPKVEI